jgi:hypothetical protein
MSVKFTWSALFSSKTVWFNIIVFIIALLALPEFLKVLPQSWLPYDLLGGAIGNLILKIWFNTTAIASSPKV